MVPAHILPTTFPVTCHTDTVGQGSTFVAIKGYSDDGVCYIRTAITKGATTIVVHKDVIFDNTLQNDIVKQNICVQRVEDTRESLATLSARAAGFPAQKLKIIGITGTKGKTTTAFLLEHCLRTAHYKTALISSAGNKIDDILFPAALTTPQADYLQQFLHACVTQSVEYVVMEVAAQALTLHRVKGVEFDGIIFTNFSHEHLEFYATLDDYYRAKCIILQNAKKDAPVVCNADDEKYRDFCAQSFSSKKIGYGFCNNADYKGTHSNVISQSASLQVAHDNNSINLECFSLFGHYNEYNMLAAIAMAHSLGISYSSIAHACATFSGVPGRLQQIALPNNARAFIDYAHNPSSFTAVLSTLRLLTPHLIVVFGAGGGKDTFKRPIMGKIASDYADIIVITSDNPRFENPNDIIADIIKGIDKKHTSKVVIIPDRAHAIIKAYECSTPDSIIAILGKGPDEYQIVGKTKHYFSEQQILKQLCRQEQQPAR